MLINAKVKSNSSENSIKEDKENNRLIICVKEKPKQNKANITIINLIAKHFKANVSHIKIKSGKTLSKKVIEIKI